MRVLFDLTSATRRDGVSRWTQGVLSALPPVAPEWHLSAAIVPETEVDLPPSIDLCFAPHAKRDRYLALAGRDRRVRSLGIGRFDAVVGPAFVAWKGDGAAEIPVVHDLAYLRFPQTLSRKNLVYLTRMVPRSLKRASAVVTVSDQVAAELRGEYGLAPELVHVVPGAADLPRPSVPVLPDGVPPRFVLMVGTLEPRKNIEAGLRAMDALRARRGDVPPVVLVAGPGWRSSNTEEMIAERIRAGSLIHLQNVDDVELASLYGEARALLFPSQYEGFGLPVLEAMHSGCPVVCNDIPVLHEIGGDTLWYAPAADPERFAAAIEDALVSDDAQDRIEAALARARRYSWESSAEKLRRIVEAVAGGG